MIVLALLTGAKRTWVWGRELDYEREQSEKALAEQKQQYEQRLTEQRQRQERDMQSSDEQLKFYMNIAFRSLQQAQEIKGAAQGAVTAAEQAVDLIERRSARRHS